MELLSGIHQEEDYAPQNMVAKNTGPASTLPRLEDLLTGIGSIDAVIKSEYDKLVSSTQKEVAATVPQPSVATQPTSQNGNTQTPSPTADITKKSKAFPPNIGFWSA
jgi:hypothetical protein